MKDEPFTGVIWLLFGWCAYVDGSMWLSGACTAVGAIWVSTWLFDYFEKRQMKS